MGEVNTGLNTTQVVVKELKASANMHDQMHFLEEAQPYRYFINSVNCVSDWISAIWSSLSHLRSYQSARNLQVLIYSHCQNMYDIDIETLV